MKKYVIIGSAMFAGIGIGAFAGNALHAQSNAPGAYVVVDISAINDPEVFKTLLPKAGPAMAPFGGKYVIRTDNIAGLAGTAPKRFVLISFDSIDKAKAFEASAAQKEVNAIAEKSSNVRRFIVDGAVQ